MMMMGSLSLLVSGVTLSGEDISNSSIIIEMGKHMKTIIVLPDPFIMACMLPIILAAGVIQAILAYPLYYVVLKGKETYSLFIRCIVSITTGLILYFGEKFFLDCHCPNNNVLRFLVSCIGVIAKFKFVEIFLDTTPKPAKQSFTNFVNYFISPAEPKYIQLEDAKEKKVYELKKISNNNVLSSAIPHIVTILGNGIATFIFYSTMEYYDYQFFQNHDLNSLLHVFNFFFGLGSTLSTYALLSVLILKVEPITVMEAPLFKSTSPKDFWNRWNKVIHNLLKRSLFIYIIKKMNVSKEYKQNIGSFLAFLISGLFHEFMWYQSFGHQHKIRYGEVTIFFILQFLIITIEIILTKFIVPEKLQNKLAKNVPQPIKLLLCYIIMTPTCKYFVDNLVLAKYYKDFSMGTTGYFTMEKSIM